jgi:AI-2 transport protein TqsA
MDDTARRSPLPRGLLILLGAAAMVIVAAGIGAIGWLIAPAFLAWVIVIVIAPIGQRLRAVGLPAWLSTVVLVLLVYGVVVVMAGVLVLSAARLATVLPQYTAEANGMLSALGATLRSYGVGAEQVRALVAGLDVGKVAVFIGALLAGVVGLATNLVFLLSLLLFISLEAGGADLRVQAMVGDRPLLGAALADFIKGIRRYLVVTTIFGVVIGLLDTAALAVLGIPLAVTWGLLAFITNYIPYVGFWLGVLPPAVLSLLVGGPRLLVIVVVIYLVVNFVFTSLLQPRFVGDAVGLSITVTFVALVFWGWLLGPVGAVLAVPMTLLVKALLVDSDPDAGWMNALLGSPAAVRRLRDSAELRDPPRVAEDPPPAG